jgi:hypothetical protein
MLSVSNQHGFVDWVHKVWTISKFQITFCFLVWMRDGLCETSITIAVRHSLRESWSRMTTCSVWSRIVCQFHILPFPLHVQTNLHNFPITVDYQLRIYSSNHTVMHGSYCQTRGNYCLFTFVTLTKDLGKIEVDNVKSTLCDVMLFDEVYNMSSLFSFP